MPLSSAITWRTSVRACATAGCEPDAELEQIATLETRRRRLIPEMEGLKREQNAAGDEVARAKRQGKDASDIFAANKARAQQIRQLEVAARSGRAAAHARC